MKFAVILGTRPEIIKLSSLIRELENSKTDYIVIHSNQHYSKEMDEIFFRELELPKPDYNLNVGSLSHAKMTAAILEKLEDIFIQEKPDVIFVQGDTNTVMAGALAASKLGIKIAHIEAGLRSYDRSMPEEVNRIITDHISDYLFPPTPTSAKLLEEEGIGKSKIAVVGNTIVDAVYQNLEIANRKSDILSDLGLAKDDYLLLTLHRPSNVDEKNVIERVLKQIKQLAIELKLPVVFPIHPRTKKQIEKFGLNLPGEIREIEPVGFLEMLQLEKNAKLILTDSGGIQEEACILKIPCLTIRENTERPETVEVGANLLAGTDLSNIITLAQTMLGKARDWQNPFGDGKSAQKILKFIIK